MACYQGPGTFQGPVEWTHQQPWRQPGAQRQEGLCGLVGRRRVCKSWWPPTEASSSKSLLTICPAPTTGLLRACGGFRVPAPQEGVVCLSHVANSRRYLSSRPPGAWFRSTGPSHMAREAGSSGHPAGHLDRAQTPHLHPSSMAASLR